MRKFFIYIFLLLSTTAITAQINELGVFLGGSNYIGDIGPTNYINGTKVQDTLTVYLIPTLKLNQLIAIVMSQADI